MIKKIAKVALVLVAVIFTTSVATAQTQTDTTCTTSPDYGVGRTTNCTSTSTAPTPPPPPIVDPEDARKLGGALGALVARKRQEHADEKSILVQTVYCRANPTASFTWWGSDKIATCQFLERYTQSYCVVHGKEKLCKDIAKLGPAPAVAAAAPPVQKTQPAEQPTPQQQPVTTAQPQQAPVTAPPVQKVTVPQSQTANVTATPTPDVSVAEAARQARIAKAVREAKEKAERDNPPPPQQ